MTLLIVNGTVVTGGAEPEVLHGHAVAAGERIEAVGPQPLLLERYPGARRLDARGGLVLPGLVNLHHHFYSAFARGLDPGPGVASFPRVLERLWWRLDQALDPEAVLFASLFSLAESIRAGVTTVFDHHASPPCIRGILDVIAAAVREAGVSAVLCYEVSDRNGHDEAILGLDENLRFAEERAGDPRLRGALGLHAAFTLRDETLRRAGHALPPGVAVHVHAAEDPVDAGPIARLEGAGLLGERTLLAHGVHLTRAELAWVAQRGCVVVHNPESNMHNGVGRLDLTSAARLGCAVGLGTDGMSPSILRALRAAFLLLRHGEHDPSAGLPLLPRLLATNARTAALLFDEPLLGTLAEGAPADLIVVDVPPPTALDARNVSGHLVYGAAEAPVRHTVARGRVLLQDFNLLSLDLRTIARRLESASRDVWRRFGALEAKALHAQHVPAEVP